MRACVVCVCVYHKQSSVSQLDPLRPHSHLRGLTRVSVRPSATAPCAPLLLLRVFALRVVEFALRVVEYIKTRQEKMASGDFGPYCLMGQNIGKEKVKDA